MAKIYDVVATVGTYQKDGEKKYLNKNVGSVIETKHGLAIQIDAHFNLAALPMTEDGKVWLKLFEPQDSREDKPQDQSAPQPQQRSPQPQQTNPTPPPMDSFDDDIPF